MSIARSLRRANYLGGLSKGLTDLGNYLKSEADKKQKVEWFKKIMNSAQNASSDINNVSLLDSSFNLNAPTFGNNAGSPLSYQPTDSNSTPLDNYNPMQFNETFTNRNPTDIFNEKEKTLSNFRNDNLANVKTPQELTQLYAISKLIGSGIVKPERGQKRYGNNVFSTTNGAADFTNPLYTIPKPTERGQKRYGNNVFSTTNGAADFTNPLYTIPKEAKKITPHYVKGEDGYYYDVTTGKRTTTKFNSNNNNPKNINDISKVKGAIDKINASIPEPTIIPSKADTFTKPDTLYGENLNTKPEMRKIIAQEKAKSASYDYAMIAKAGLGEAVKAIDKQVGRGYNVNDVLRQFYEKYPSMSKNKDILETHYKFKNAGKL